jgi:hypothetical protein
MMLRLVCTCGHIGVVDAHSLPRELTCSACGESRRVEVAECKRIRNTTAFVRKRPLRSPPGAEFIDVRRGKHRRSTPAARRS